MASIGGVTVWDFLGEVKPLQAASEVFSRPGVSGHGVVGQGLRGDPYTLTVRHDETSTSNREAKITALRALGGGIVTVVDPDGNTFSRQLVKDFGAPVRKNFLLATGGSNGGKYFFEMDVVLQAV